MRPDKIRLRGLHACVIGCDRRDTQNLQQQLTRLGMEVAFFAEFPAQSAFTHADVLLFDGDNPALFHPTDRLAWPALPKIALTMMETPSRLQWIVDQQIAGYLRKPVRSDGVMTALMLALHSWHQRCQLEQQMKRQEERLKARRYVFSVQLLLMQSLALDEPAAWSLMRTLAMQQQKTIEQYSVDALAHPQHALALAHEALKA